MSCSPNRPSPIENSDTMTSRSGDRGVVHGQPAATRRDVDRPPIELGLGVRRDPAGLGARALVVGLAPVGEEGVVVGGPGGAARRRRTQGRWASSRWRTPPWRRAPRTPGPGPRRRTMPPRQSRRACSTSGGRTESSESSRTAVSGSMGDDVPVTRTANRTPRRWTGGRDARRRQGRGGSGRGVGAVAPHAAATNNAAAASPAERRLTRARDA